MSVSSWQKRRKQESHSVVVPGSLVATALHRGFSDIRAGLATVKAAVKNFLVNTITKYCSHTPRLFKVTGRSYLITVKGGEELGLSGIAEASVIIARLAVDLFSKMT